jgi:hypothetical protein
MSAAQGPMLPEIKDFSSLLMANDPAGERPVFGSAESELRRVKRIEHRDNGQRRQPIGVDGGRLRPTVARDRFAAPKIALEEPAVA